MINRLFPEVCFIFFLAFMVIIPYGCAKKEPASLVLKNGKIVTVDESMPEAEARALVAQWHPLSEAVAAVDRFIRFLETTEHAERSAWIPLLETPAVAPELRKRFERQRQVLLGSSA